MKIPGISVSSAIKDALGLLPKLSLYLIGPWLALSVLNIEWWKLTPYFQYVTLNVLNVISIPFIFSLIHLLDAKSAERLITFMRGISAKIWISLGIFTAWMVFSAALFNPDFTKYTGIPLISAMAFLQLSLFLVLPTGLIIWRLFFLEGIQCNQELFNKSIIKSGYTGLGWSLFWRSAVIVGPMALLTALIPTNFLWSALSLIMMIFADTYIYALSRQFFRKPLTVSS